MCLNPLNYYRLRLLIDFNTSRSRHYYWRIDCESKTVVFAIIIR